MKSYLKTSDYFLTQEPFELLHDEELDMLITLPRPSDLDKYYDTTSYISHKDEVNSFTERIYQWVKNINLRSKLSLIQKHSNGKRDLLDVGAGTGEFLSYAKNKGWRIKGVEPNPNANQIALEKGLELKKDLKEFQDQKFDVITLWHVLEHLPELETSVELLCQMTKENGTLVVAVPNFKSFDASYYKRYWAAFDVPRHLWHFSKGSIERLFVKHNMQVVEIKPMWFDSYYVSLLSEEYKTGKKNWVKAFCIGLWSNISGLFSKEYSSHIYILKKVN